MKQILQLGTLSAVNIFLIFLFQWYILTQLGPGQASDALFAGMTIPQLVLAVISGSLIHVLVPILAGETEDRLRHDSWGLLVLVGGMFAIFSFLLYISAPWWVRLSVPGFTDVGLSLTVELTRIQLIGMIFTAINGVQWAAYHSRQQFLYTEVTQIITNTLAILLLILTLSRYGVVAAAWISTLRIVLHTLLLMPGMGKPVSINIKSVAIQQAWQRIKPLLLGTAYYKTDPLIDRYLLSKANSGSLSLYYFAQQIYGAVTQIINKAIATPLVPLLSKLHKAGNHHEFRKIYNIKLFQVGIICISGTLFMGLFGKRVLDIFIGHGYVSNYNINELWLMLIFLSGSFIGGAMGQISSSAFYALGDTTTTTRIGAITFTLFLPLKIIIFSFFDVIGLACGTSIFVLLNILLQNYKLGKILEFKVEYDK